MSTPSKLQFEIENLKAENAKLRAALAPFAAIGQIIIDQHPGWDHSAFQCGFRPPFDTLGSKEFTAAAHLSRNKTAVAIDRFMNPTPEMIGAAWRAFRRDRMGRLGPGPGFAEAIRAAGVAALKEAEEASRERRMK